MEASYGLPAPFVLPKPSAQVRRGKPAKVSQILAMQRELMAKVMDSNVEPKQKASCACAWEKLEAMLRKIRGIPDPGILRPDNPKPKHKPQPTGPLEE